MFDDNDSIGFALALEALRADIVVAQENARSAGMTFPISDITVELKVGVTRQADGKAGFRIPFVNAELGAQGSWRSETLQTVTVVLGSPIAHDGTPVHVRSSTDVEKG